MKEKIRYAVTAVHILCSFLWRNLVFEYVGINPSGTITVKEVISDKAERVLTYSLSELFACIFIFLFWKLVFEIFCEYKKYYALFLTIFMVGGFLVLAGWPEVFAGPDYLSDNLVSLSSAIRLTPDYWHCAYTSIIYAGAILMIPVKSAVTLLQWAFFVYMVAYIFGRSKNVVGKWSYLLLLLFVFPNAPEIMTYSHRMCMYVIALSLYSAMIIMDLINNAEISGRRVAGIALFGAFLSVWRTEGIVIGFLLFLMYAFLYCRKRVAKTVAYCALFFALFFVISIPQKLGDAKYYGNDYKLINSFEPLRTILNASEANLSYEGAEEDLADISEVVGADIIREYGAEGYRKVNNGVKLHPDINQSCVTNEVSTRYLKAYRNVVMHNIFLYVKHQLNTAFTAAGLEPVFETELYSGEHIELPDWSYIGWNNGAGDLYGDKLTATWRSIPFRARYANKLLRTRVAYTAFAKRTGIYAWGMLLLALGNLFVFIHGLVRIKRDSNAAVLGFASFAVLTEFVAILAVMPVAATIYFFSCGYLFAIILYLKLQCVISKRKLLNGL